MNLPDEALQNQIEKNTSVDNTIDALAYKKVFEVLKQEPRLKLSPRFADFIINRIEARVARTSLQKEYVWMGLGIFSLIIAAFISIELTGFKINFGALLFISSHAGLLVFGIAFILLLHWLDKRMLHPTFKI